MRTVSSVPRTGTAALPFAVILRAALLGALTAGVAGALVSWLLVEIPIRSALAIESGRAQGEPGHGHSEEMFSRGTQVIGGMLAAVLVALAFGVVFAVAYARLRPRLPGYTDFGRALTLALAGFVVISLLPAIKYPANPPAVGDPETVDTRTMYYFSFLAAAIVLTLAVSALRRRFPSDWPASWSATAAAVLIIAGYALLIGAWPAGPDRIPADVPAELIWRFRLSSLAELAVLWTTLGLVTGLLLERAHRDDRKGSPT